MFDIFVSWSCVWKLKVSLFFVVVSEKPLKKSARIEAEAMLQRLNTSSGNLDEAGRQVGESITWAPKKILRSRNGSLAFCEDDESWCILVFSCWNHQLLVVSLVMSRDVWVLRVFVLNTVAFSGWLYNQWHHCVSVCVCVEWRKTTWSPLKSKDGNTYQKETHYTTICSNTVLAC